MPQFPSRSRLERSEQTCCSNLTLSGRFTKTAKNSYTCSNYIHPAREVAGVVDLLFWELECNRRAHETERSIKYHWTYAGSSFKQRYILSGRIYILPGLWRRYQGKISNRWSASCNWSSFSHPKAVEVLQEMDSYHFSVLSGCNLEQAVALVSPIFPSKVLVKADRLQKIFLMSAFRTLHSYNDACSPWLIHQAVENSISQSSLQSAPRLRPGHAGMLKLDKSSEEGTKPSPVRNADSTLASVESSSACFTRTGLHFCPVSNDPLIVLLKQSNKQKLALKKTKRWTSLKKK